MDTYSSGEDLIIKARKPYTITKQRERWTEEEHSSFLEAIKLYGRAWQRIEEHIGTKTAVQIRSHAQKFFTKLEKEAIVKGVGHGLDIEIPPPRPKRKPSNPYPRKPSTFTGSEDGKVSDPTFPLSSKKMTLAIEKESEKLCDDAKLQNSNKCHGENNCSEAFDILAVAPCTFPEATRKSSSFRQYVPTVNESSNQDGSTVSVVTTDPMEIHAETVHKNQLFHDKTLRGESFDDENEQGSQSYPHHIPVHILDGSFGRTGQQVPLDMSCMQQYMFGQSGCDKNMFFNPPASATSEHYGNVASSTYHQLQFLNYHPFYAPMQNPDDYQSLLQVSSTFSSLILSALSQNASAYAAASFAATIWPPYFNMEAPSVEPKPVNPPSSLTPIAAATVAAATSWWAANGLLHLYPRFRPGFAFSPSATAIQVENVNGDRRETSIDPALGDQQLDPEFSEAQNSADTEASEAEKLNEGGLTAPETAEVDVHDSNNSKNKQVDRSSCGSNTPSSSEVEVDAMENHTNTEEEKLIHTNEELEAVLPTIDLFSRRCRYNNTIKEVSEEGRLAFQALFSREVLPQSFSPPHGLKNKRIGKQEIENNISISISGANKQEGSLNEGLGHIKLKAPRTGFKPYKRCSMEAKETRISGNSQGEEKDPKKLRLEGEASV